MMKGKKYDKKLRENNSLNRSKVEKNQKIQRGLVCWRNGRKVIMERERERERDYNSCYTLNIGAEVERQSKGHPVCWLK